MVPLCSHKDQLSNRNKIRTIESQTQGQKNSQLPSINDCTLESTQQSRKFNYKTYHHSSKYNPTKPYLYIKEQRKMANNISNNITFGDHYYNRMRANKWACRCHAYCYCRNKYINEYIIHSTSTILQ